MEQLKITYLTSLCRNRISNKFTINFEKECSMYKFTYLVHTDDQTLLVEKKDHKHHVECRT